LAVCERCDRELQIEEGSVCDECRQHELATSPNSAGLESQSNFGITNLLLFINFAVFLWMMVKRVPLFSPSADQIIRWGANFGPLSLDGQPWRLLTAVFVHIGLAHLLANMLALLVLGRLAESLFGRLPFLLIYLLAGLAGSFSTLIWNPMAVSAGASGALFGTVGALIAALYTGKLPVPRRVLRHVLITLVMWATFTLVYQFWKPGVDNAAHIGGLIAGSLMGVALGRSLADDRLIRRSRQKIFSIAALVIAVLGIVTWRLQGYVVAAENARQLLSKGKNDEAVEILQRIVHNNPRAALAHGLLGDAFLRKSDFDGAEQEYQRALQLDPRNAMAWARVADLRSRQKRWSEAADDFTRAAQLMRNDSGMFLYNAGLMYRQLDRQTDAIKSFQGAVAKNPNLVEAWYAMGISFLNLKQGPEASKALQRALQLRPNDPEIHLWLGNALLVSGKQEQAEIEFLKAYQLRALQQKIRQQSGAQPH
jgi:membrane associated rhomboid family serine protease/Flp pilus assembly protein TadD